MTQQASKDRQQLTLWDVGAADPRKILSINADSDTTVTDYAPAAKLAGAVSKRDIILFSTETGAEVRRFSVKPIKTATKVRLSPDGKLALLIGYDDGDSRTAVLADAGNGKLRHRFAGRRGSADLRDNTLPTEAVFSADGRRLAIGRFDGTAEIWDIRSLKRTRLLPAAPGDDADQIWSLAFSADGKNLVAGSRDGGAFLWNVEQARPARAYTYQSLAGHVHLAAAAVSRDGSTVIGGVAQHSISSGDAGREVSIHVWKAANATPRLSLRNHRRGIAALTFTPDDRFIVSASYDGTIKYWSSDTGKCVATTIMSADGHWVTVSDSGFYSGDADGADMLSFSRGFSARAASQFRSELHRPDLIAELLKGDPNRRYAAAAKQLDLNGIWEAAVGR